MINVIKYAGTCATPQDINAHAEKLAFNTREEYFEWVKQWKEDYKNTVLLHRMEKLYHRSHDYVWVDGNGRTTSGGWQYVQKTSKKAALKQSKLTELKRQHIIDEKSLAIKLHEQIKNEYNYQHWAGKYSWLVLVRYMLAVRRASKLRAGKKREERLKSVV